MSKTKIVGAAAAAFFGVTLVASAGYAYTYEATNTWFDTVTYADLGVFSTPEGCEASVDGAKIVFDADVTSPLGYDPTDSGPVAVVNVKLDIDPNVAEPTTEGLDNAQAALTVVTNTSLNRLEWRGLVRDGESNRWENLYGDYYPTEGQTYDVQIVVDNHDTEKYIKYLVKGPDPLGYTVLTNSTGASRLLNPKTNREYVASVAFAGAGKLTSLSGENVVNAGAEITTLNNVAGFDFTNGTVSATVTFAGGEHTAVLTVYDLGGNPTVLAEQSVTSGESISWNLSSLNAGAGLNAGEIYDYTIVIKAGTEECARTTGTFTAANWDEWFGLHASPVATNNGEFASAEFATDKWNISGEATFTITNKEPGSNAVSRVDTKYSFDTFIDVDSLDPLDNDSVGGIVAVEGGSWYAYAFTNGSEKGWAQLSGGVTADTNIDYVVRAEFDYISNDHRVRYFVSSDNGTTFYPLTLGGNDWISLTKTGTTSLQSVEMSGKGSVKDITAKIADEAVVVDATGKKFATVWDAIKNGTGPFTLLTNATLKPTGDMAKMTFTIDKDGFSLNLDRSELGKWTLVDNEDGTYTLSKAGGATYLFY